MDSISCVICGGNTFEPAYGGRVGPNGGGPLCKGCGSVERHRVVFAIYQRIKTVTQKSRALQFAPDVSVEKTNFQSYTGSTYNGENSMDMTNTNLPSGSFDIVLSNHVLEHVQDDVAALKECLRLVGDTGFVHICVPSPSYWPFTDDWGYADESKAFHFRHYGGDIGYNLTQKMPGIKCMSIVGRDVVTDANDAVFFFASSDAPLRQISTKMTASEFTCIKVA